MQLRDANILPPVAGEETSPIVFVTRPMLSVAYLDTEIPVCRNPWK